MFLYFKFLERDGNRGLGLLPLYSLDWIGLCVRYCQSVMADGSFSSGPESWRRAAQNESTVGLDRTAKGSLFQSEMVRGKSTYSNQHERTK